MGHTEKIAADGHFIFIVTSGSQQPAAGRQQAAHWQQGWAVNPSPFPSRQPLNCLDILGGIMNWTLPQMSPVTKRVPPLTGRWGHSDSLTAKQKAAKRGRGNQDSPLLFSPQFHFSELSFTPR